MRKLHFFHLNFLRDEHFQIYAWHGGTLLWYRIDNKSLSLQHQRKSLFRLKEDSVLPFHYVKSSLPSFTQTVTEKYLPHHLIDKRLKRKIEKKIARGSVAYLLVYSRNGRFM